MLQPRAITLTAYQGFQQAYDFFNRELFARSLPQVLVTLQRHAKTYGYFSPQRFSGRLDKRAVHELALNPDGFHGRTDGLILSTLVHEMCHVWQETHGTPPRRGYHDRQWATKMREIGLQPSSTGEEGGKETGQSVSHYPDFSVVLFQSDFMLLSEKNHMKALRNQWVWTMPYTPERLVGATRRGHTMAPEMQAPSQ